MVKYSQKRLLTIFCLGLFSPVLTSCSTEPPAAMPPAQITRFVLDLSGSNDAQDQYSRLKPAIYNELKLDSIGNPFSPSPTGPVDLSITFILESASQARVEAITESEFGFKLYDDLRKVYGRTDLQAKKDWDLIVATDRKAIDKGSSANLTSCIGEVFATMSPRLGDKTSQAIAERLCDRAINTIDTIENQVPKSILLANGSDIFGAFREIDTWAEKIKSSRPDSKIKVVFASDMVHYTNGQRDLLSSRGLITGLIGKNEICSIAENQATLSALNLKDVVVEIIGRGNSSSVSADEGEALSIFWKCFAESSGFELNTMTDGRS
jgi:hypothetical protein